MHVVLYTNQGDILDDVGIYLDKYSFVVSNLFGKSRKIIYIEPYGRNFASLRRLFKLYCLLTMEGIRNLSRDLPRVSIGMPVFNGEKYLRESIEAILHQTYPDFEQ